MRKFFVLLCAAATIGVAGASPAAPAARRHRQARPGSQAAQAKVRRRGEANRLRQEQTPTPGRTPRMAAPVSAPHPLTPLPEVPGVTWHAV